jgi:uncharacterized protein YwqG
MTTAIESPMSLWIEHIKTQLEPSRRPAALIQWQATEQPMLTGSRLGGPVYVPSDAAHPMCDGKPLVFLAQINLAELPAMTGFPRHGLVQFFIACDDVYGCTFEPCTMDNNSSYRVVYWPDPQERADWVSSIQPDAAVDGLPHDPTQCFAMQFTATDHLAGPQDIVFEQLFGTDFFEIEPPTALNLDADHARDTIFDVLTINGSHVGGYPSFTQYDPRPSDSRLVLLLQLDTDDSVNMMWGDSGIANFFIDPKQLAAADFSQVLYNWDCC